jgi:hypothetical protein
MIRTLTTLSVLAMAAALAAPAFAEDSVVVNLSGKSAPEAYAAIAAAARTVCHGARISDPLGIYTPDLCVADTVEATIAKVKNPDLTQYSRTRGAYLTLASN